MLAIWKPCKASTTERRTRMSRPAFKPLGLSTTGIKLGSALPRPPAQPQKKHQRRRSGMFILHYHRHRLRGRKRSVSYSEVFVLFLVSFEVSITCRFVTVHIREIRHFQTKSSVLLPNVVSPTTYSPWRRSSRYSGVCIKGCSFCTSVLIYNML